MYSFRFSVETSNNGETSNKPKKDPYNQEMIQYHVICAELHLAADYAYFCCETSDQFRLVKKFYGCIVNVNVSALKIHMSENAHDALAPFPEFITQYRGDTIVKVDRW